MTVVSLTVRDARSEELKLEADAKTEHVIAKIAEPHP